MKSNANFKETAIALAKIANASQATPEQFEALVGRLELLRDLQGEKAFQMVSDKALRQRIAQLTNGDLEGLAGSVGQELARLAYAPVAKHPAAREVL